MLCSVKYQHDMSTRTVSALIFCTRTSVMLSVAAKYILSAAAAVVALSDVQTIAPQRKAATRRTENRPKRLMNITIKSFWFRMKWSS